MNQLLDAMQGRLAPLPVELGRLVPEEPVDVRIAPVDIDAARGGERLDPGGRVSENSAQAVDDVLELLLLIRLEKPRPLEGTQLRPDAGRLQVVIAPISSVMTTGVVSRRRSSGYA